MGGADAALPMLRMCIACVAARATAVLDVCVLAVPPHRCVSVAVVMSSAVRSMRIDALGGAPNAATVTALERLLADAGGARHRDASGGAPTSSE
jgi:hypothetical protein